LQLDALLIEAVIVVPAVAILGVYHWRLWRKSRLTPMATAMGRHRLVRAAWVETLQDGNRDLLAVHTIRNWIMSAALLASTSILFSLGVLGAAFTNDKLSHIAHQLNFVGSEDTRLWLFKGLVLLVIFLAAFFNFSLAIRSFIHAGFAINLTRDQKVTFGKNLGDEELERGAAHYTLGLRAYYLAFPFTLWLFGPLWMLAGSILLVVLLRRVD
jgi:uncharacterized membrane protein